MRWSVDQSPPLTPMPPMPPMHSSSTMTGTTEGGFRVLYREKKLSPPAEPALSSARLARRGASSGDVRWMEQGAAPAGVVRDHALGRPRDPAPRHYDRAQGALLEGASLGNQGTPREARPRGQKSPPVERRKACGRKPMRPRRIDEVRHRSPERRPALHSPSPCEGHTAGRPEPGQRTGPAELCCLTIEKQYPRGHLFQHRAGGDVDRAADRVGGDNLALEVLDLPDGSVLHHE
jgi:hypothetical protein